jgi:hypothetical protein
MLMLTHDRPPVQQTVQATAFSPNSDLFDPIQIQAAYYDYGLVSSDGSKGLG